MSVKYTTLRVKPTTRDIINKQAIDKKLSVDEFLSHITESKKDTMKQILLNIDQEKFYALEELTKILYKMKLIEFPTMEYAVQLAVDNLITGMRESLSRTQEATMLASQQEPQAGIDDIVHPQPTGGQR